MLDKLLNWFYGTWVGGLYFELLLFIDRIKSKRDTKKYFNPNTKQIVRQAQRIKIEQGVGKIKRKVNQLAGSKTKEDYEKTLEELKELMPLAENESKELKEMKKALHQVWVFKGGKDVRNNLDRAKMVEKRIKHYEDLQRHKLKREEIRKKRKNANK